MKIFSNNFRNTIITENHVFLTLIFIVFGFYGAGTINNSSENLLYLFSPLIVFLVFLKNSKNDENLFNLIDLNNDIISRKHLFILALFLIIFIFLSWNKIFMSLADDEYAYTSVGLAHSILLTTKIANKIELLQNFKVSFLIQLISLLSLLFLLSILIFIFFFLKDNFFVKVFVIFTILFSLRSIIFYLGGNNFPHPPLLGFTPYVITSIIGLSDLNLKLSYFLLYILFSFYFYIKLNNKISSLSSFIITTVLFSTPGLLYLGTSIEQSLWSTICFSIILIELSDNKSLSYKKLFIIILIFSFMMVLSFISVSAIIIYVIFNSKSIKDAVVELKNVAKSSYPLIILIPFLFYTFVDNSDITVDRVGFELIGYFNTLKELPFLIIDSLTIPLGIITLFFLLLSFFYNRKSLALIFFIFVLITIYSKVLGENTKYIFEIFFPFLLAFTFILINNFKKNIYKKILIFFLLCIFPFNIFILKNFSSYCLNSENPLKENLTYEVDYGCNIIDAKPFNLKEAFLQLKKEEDFSFGNLYVPGVYYGLLPSIINGMKMRDLTQHKDINQQQNRLNSENGVEWISASTKLINKDNRIKFVLVADTKNFTTLRKELTENSWEEFMQINIIFTKQIYPYLKKNV